MKMSVADMADKYSICLLKSRYLKEAVEPELQALKAELDGYKDVNGYIERLIEINDKIWALEADIRQGKENKLGLEEVGRRAIAIRNNNKIRIQIKNEITKKFKEGFEEIKVNHASV